MPHINFEEVDSKITPNPLLLVQDVIPKPLWGVNPRLIKGKEWWDKVRKEVYATHFYRCMACGQLPDDHPVGGLHAHERYDVDWAKGRATFIEVVALAECCHSFVHLGRSLSEVAHSSKSRSLFLECVEYCLDVLKMHKVKLSRTKYQQLASSRILSKKVKQLINSIEVGNSEPLVVTPKWRDWRMIFEDNEYSPMYNTEFQTNLYYLLGGE